MMLCREDGRDWIGYFDRCPSINCIVSYCSLVFANMLFFMEGRKMVGGARPVDEEIPRGLIRLCRDILMGYNIFYIVSVCEDVRSFVVVA